MDYSPFVFIMGAIVGFALAWLLYLVGVSKDFFDD
jgi:hypothetical protein